jgi:hypothetical protein
MSRLLPLIYEIRRKITDNEYKIILDEITNEEKRKQAFSLSKVKISIPWVGKQLEYTDECGDDPITIRHEFITLIVPTKYIQDNNITICKTYPLMDIFNNSLNNDIDSFIYNIEMIHINSIQIHNKTCIIIAIDPINKDSSHQDLDMEM